MPNVALYNMDGKEVGTIELNESVFGAEVNKVAIYETVKNYLAKSVYNRFNINPSFN